jgi:1,4-alpha-glucan branching enzyme
MQRSHAMPFGSEIREDVSVRFRRWVPKAQFVELCVGEGTGEQLLLDRLEQERFELVTSAAIPGSHDRFRIDGGCYVPDSASRFQPCLSTGVWETPVV